MHKTVGILFQGRAVSINDFHSPNAKGTWQMMMTSHVEMEVEGDEV